VIQLILTCDVCGKPGPSAKTDGVAPRTTIEGLRSSKGWSRCRRRHTESMQDHCPDCLAELRSRQATRNGTTRRRT